MKREILCNGCAKSIKKLFPSEEPFPGEHVKFVEGKAINEYRCDECSCDIKTGTNCVTFSCWTDYSKAKYFPWEEYFIEIAEDKNKEAE